MLFKVGFSQIEIFAGKHLCWSLFSIKLQAFRPAILLKRDYNKVVFQWILQNFKNNFFNRTHLTSGGCFWKSGANYKKNWSCSSSCKEKVSEVFLNFVTTPLNNFFPSRVTFSKLYQVFTPNVYLLVNIRNKLGFQWPLLA